MERSTSSTLRCILRNAGVLTLVAALSACGHGVAPSAGPAASGGAMSPDDALISQTFVQHLDPPQRPPVPTVKITGAMRAAAAASGWVEVTATAPFGSNGAGTALLMTDGTVMIQDNGNNWYSLTPDDTGNYVNGTWATKASLPSGYGPLYFASAILPDGKLIVNGGEYNNGAEAETNKGAIYDPVANTWTSVAPPTGWGKIGDASSVVLADGTYMIASCCTSKQALLDESTMTWTVVGTGKADADSEEGWALLPDGDVLTVDIPKEPNSEEYNPSTETWSSAGSLPVNIANKSAYEIGPEILRQNGTLLATGADKDNAIYNTSTGAWSKAPVFPVVGGKQLDIADGPATLLTDTDVLMAASPGTYSTPVHFLVFNGTKFTVIGGPADEANDSSYNVRLLLLPNGQVLETDGSNDVEIYTPSGAASTTYAPAIGSVPTTLTPGQTYTVSGTHLNGYSQANAYGDDVQEAENYPLVRVTMTATGHVFYLRTHTFSSMAVANPSTVSAQFDVPAGIETGSAQLVVVADGIASSAVDVTIP